MTSAVYNLAATALYVLHWVEIRDMKSVMRVVEIDGIRCNAGYGLTSAVRNTNTPHITYGCYLLVIS